MERHSKELANFDIELGRHLQQLRVNAGLSQVSLAAELGVDQTIISKVEGGHRRLSVSELLSWSEALGVSANVLTERVFELWQNTAARPGTLWKSPR